MDGGVVLRNVHKRAAADTVAQGSPGVSAACIASGEGIMWYWFCLVLAFLFTFFFCLDPSRLSRLNFMCSPVAANIILS